MFFKPLTDVPPSSAVTSLAHLGALVFRFILFLLVWWVITEGRIREPFISLSCVALAAGISLWLWPPLSCRWNLLQILRFLPWFLWNSILGGVDVARRAFQNQMDLKPGIIPIKLTLTEKPRLLFAWTVSLLPGTACITMNGDTLYIHALDVRTSTEGKLRELELRLGKLCR